MKVNYGKTVQERLADVILQAKADGRPIESIELDREESRQYRLEVFGQTMLSPVTRAVTETTYMGVRIKIA